MEFQPLAPKAAGTVRLAREHRVNVWEGAVRSGKTVSSLVAWTDFIANAPEGPLLMAGKTVDTLRRNVIDPLIDLLGTANVKVVWGVGVAWILGRKVHLVGAANEMSESRIRGLTLSGAYVDEATVLPQSWWQMLLSRLSVEGAKVFVTTNPASPQHWLLVDYLERAQTVLGQDCRVERFPVESGIARYRFTIDDNPTLPKEYVDSLKVLYSGLFYRRFIAGEWVAAEGAVFPGFDLSVGGGLVWDEACLPPLGDFEHFTVGIDHGMTNPTHAVLVGVAGGRLYVLSEFRIGGKGSSVRVEGQEQFSITQQADLLEEWLRAGCPDGGGVPRGPVVGDSLYLPYRIVVDPAAKAFRVEWNDRGLGWPWQADNTVLRGLQRVGSLMDTRQLLFSSVSTPVLNEELSGYSWDTKAQEKGVDRPLKVADHGVDALRYACMAIERAVANVFV